MEVQVDKTVVMDKMEMMAIVMMDIVMAVMLVIDVMIMVHGHIDPLEQKRLRTIVAVA